MTDHEQFAKLARSQIEACRPAPGPGPEWMRGITAIIKTFERPTCVARLVVSIRRHYPELAVLVCDDSREPLYPDESEPTPGVRWLTLPYEAGHTLGAGRNYLVDRTQTEYAFLCDDDHEFTDGTRLQAMWEFLESSGYDLVGGTQGDEDYGTAIFERRGDCLIQLFHAHRGLVADGVVACDRVSNTFLARTAGLRQVRWQPQVYAHEHADFFIRASAAGLRIAQMGRTWVGHDRACEPGRGWLGRLLGTLLPHRDGHYRLMRMGGKLGQSERQARLEAEQLYRTHVLDQHGVVSIDDDYDRARRHELEKLIGRPTDTER